MSFSPPHALSTRAATIVAVCSVVAALLGGGTTVRADPQTELAEARARLDELVARIDGAAARRDALKLQLTEVFGRLDEAERALEGVHARVATAHREIGDLSREVTRIQDILDRRAAEAYEGGHGELLAALLGAGSFADFAYTLELLDAGAEHDQDLADALVARKTELGRRRAELETLAARLQSSRDELDSTAAEIQANLAEATALAGQIERDRAEAAAVVDGLTDEVERQRARELVERSGEGSPSPEPSPDPQPTPSPTPTPDPEPDPGPEAVKEMIVQYFSPLGDEQVNVALCVAEQESDFDPNAVNPVTGAAGVYQFLPATWESLAPAAGWGGHSVFEAEANVAVAAWTVTNYGWGSWGSVATACGA